MSKCKKIVFIANDIGGGNFIVPIVAKLSQTKYQMLFIATGPTFSLWKQAKLNPINLNPDYLTEDCIFKLLKDIAPTLIVTGSSIGNQLEQFVWKIAKQLNVTTIALIDGWNKLAERFANNNGYVFPANIGLVDHQAQNLLVAAYPNLPSKIYLIGHPHLQSVVNYLAKNRTKGTKALSCISFFSTPLVNTEAAPGIHAIQQIIPILLKLYPQNNLTIWVKPHPREVKEPWAKWHYQVLQSYTNIKLVNDVPTLEILAKSDLVIGLPTNVMLEAYFAKIPTIVLAFNISNLELYPAILHYLFHNLVTTVEDFEAKLMDIANHMLRTTPDAKSIYQQAHWRVARLIHTLA